MAEMSPADFAAVSHPYGMGFNGGDSWAWIIILLFALGGGGFGGRGYADSNLARIQDVYASNDLQSIRSGINNLGNGIADATFALNNNILNQSNLLQRDMFGGFNNVQAAVEVTKDTVKDGTYATARNIDALRYDTAQQTHVITTTDTANTQKILDKLNSIELNAKDQKIQELTALLGDARLGISQRDQNAVLINSLRPCPVPAYQVPNPYCNCNCGNGFS